MDLAGAITEALSGMKCANMSNTTRGDYSYMLVDIDSDLQQDALDKINAADGVIRVRIVK